MKKKTILPLLLAVCILAGGCGSSNITENDISSEVANNLAEEINRETEEIPGDTSADVPVRDEAEEEKDTEKSDSSKETAPVTKKNIDEETSEAVYGENPFVGYESKETSYNIKFTFQADSGIAGFTWGSDNGTEGEYYLFAFEMVREFPRLYTSKREYDKKTGEEMVWDEEYTNLDMMYPEMSMFTGCAHYIEIAVDGSVAVTKLDSVEVARTNLSESKTIGQIGTWVLDGDYSAYFDDIHIAEGVDGSGDYLYSEDFSKKISIFSPYLKTENGRLYAKSGYYTVPTKEDAQKAKEKSKSGK